MRTRNLVSLGLRHRAVRAFSAIALITSGIVVGVAGVASAAATELVVQTTPAPSTTITNGGTFSTEPTILVENNGVPVADSTAITVTVNSANVTLTGTTTQTSTSTSGVTFSGLGLTGLVGSYTLTFAASTLTSATLNVTVTPGSATKLGIFRQPSAGQIINSPLVTQPVVWVEDASGNLVTGDTSSVTVALGASPVGTLGTTLTVAAVGGVATFSGLTISGATSLSGSSDTLTFTDAALTSVTSNSILLSNAPYKLALSTPPSTSVASGAAFATQPVLLVEDSNGTQVKSDTSSVTANLIAGSSSSYVTNATAVAVDGQVTYSGLAINALAGSYILTFTDGSLLSISSSTITVGVGAPAKLAIQQQPSATAQSGVVLAVQPSIAVEDSGGNVVTSSTSTVTAAFTSGGGTATFSTKAAVSGVATFTNLTLTGVAGSYTLTFSAPSLTSVVSNVISLTAGAATKLAITTQPSATAATGTVLPTTPIVKIEDASGNVVPNTAVVTATITSGGYSVSGGVVTTVSGVATFSALALNAPVGSYTLTFSASGLASAISTTITVTSGAPYKLVITTQPSATALSGVPLSVVPVVKITDVNGAQVTSNNSVVVAHFTSGGVSLTAGSTTAVGGVATFNGLALNALAGTYSLTFTDGTLISAVSTNVVVSVGPANHLVISTEPSTVAQSGVALPTQPVISVVDSGGNVVTTTPGVVTAGIAVGTGGAITAGSTASIVAGVAHFSGLAITGPSGAVYGLVFTGAGFNVTDTARISIGNVQPALVIKTVKGYLGRTLKLVTSGGAGTGAVTFGLVSAGTANCSVSGAVLSYTHVGTCVVMATKAASGTYQAVSSAPTTITIGIAPKPPILVLGFSAVAFHLNAGQARALAALVNRLSTRTLVRIIAFAPRNLGLARARGLAVRQFMLSRLHLHVQVVFITNTGGRMVKIQTIRQ